MPAKGFEKPVNDRLQGRVITQIVMPGFVIAHEQVGAVLGRQAQAVTHNGKSVRIVVNWQKPAESDEEKAMWERYIKGDHSKKVMNFVHDRKAAKVRLILDADESELMKVTKGRQELPKEARIYVSIQCDECSEKVMEPRARVRSGKILCIPCFEREE